MWTSQDGNWHGDFDNSQPVVVDETDACRLERVWPAGPAYIFTMSILLKGEYLHVLFGRRPRTSDIWAVVALMGLKMQLMLDALPPARLVH